MCIPRTTLTRHHSLISSFVSCPVCFPCSFAPCYEVLMTAEPFEEFRYSGCETSSHGLQPIVLCLWLLLSFDLELQLCLAPELSVSFLLELQLVTLKIWFRTSLVEFFGPCKNLKTAPFCLVLGLS